MTMSRPVKSHRLLQRVRRIQLFAIFEVAARHESFTAAAEELGLTQSGVSRQISELERVVDRQLFDRSANQVKLNSDGRALLVAVEAGFDEIARGLDLITPSPGTFVLAANPGFAAVWLVPRLHSLRLVFGDIQLQLHLFDRDQELRDSQWDAAIHLSANSEVPDDAIHLFGEAAQPVASPAYAELHGLTATTDPAQLRQLDLLHLDGRDRQWMGWPEWFAAHGISWSPQEASITYNNHALTIEGAMAGRGVALGWSGLVDPALDDGRLVAVGGTVENATTGYHLIPSPQSDSRHLALLASWLEETLARVAS